MHKPIKKYTQRGEIRDDSDFIRLRNELERMIIQEMKEDGILPIQDLGSFWSTKLEGKKYSYVLTMYGSYVGRVRAKEYDFWHQGRLVKSG